MFQIAFCDDDSSILEELSTLFLTYSVSKKVPLKFKSFTNGFDLISYIEKGTTFNLIYLEISMKGFTGIELAKIIRTYNPNVKIIFLSSSSEFALESYKVNATNYLLKPIEQYYFLESLDDTLHTLQTQPEPYLLLKTHGKYIKILLYDLEYCEVIRKNVYFYLIDGTVLCHSCTISAVFDKLQNHPFFIKPHRSYIINLNYIHCFSEKTLIMQSHAEIPIGRNNYKNTKQDYLDFYATEDKII